MNQAGRQVVRPQGGKRCKHRHEEHGQYQAGDDHAKERHSQIEAPCGPGLQRHGPRSQCRCLLALHRVVDGKGERSRRQQQQCHHGASLEVLLPDHELEHISRKHVEVATDHLWNAEVGDDQREGDQRGRDESVPRTRQRDGEELAHRAGAQRIGCLVEAGIGQRERCHENHQRVWKGRKAFGQHDTRRAIDSIESEREPHRFSNALVAEPVDQRDGRQQRWRQQRQQAGGPEQALERHAAARQRICERECQRHHDDGDQQRDPDAVPQAMQ